MVLAFLIFMMQTELPNIDKLWDYSDPAASELKFKSLVDEAYAAGDSMYALEASTQVARALGLQQKFEEAHAILDKIEGQILDRHKVNVRFLLERGRVFNSSKEKEKAIPLFTEALDLALALNEDFYAIDAAHMLGIAEEPGKALEWNLKTIAMAEVSNDARARKWLGSLYNNTGWTEHDRGNYGDAQELFEKSLEWNIENGTEESINIARWTVGRGLRSLKEYANAIEIQLELLEEGYDSGYVYEELGEGFLLMGDDERSSEYFKMAYEKLSEDEWLVKFEPERIQRLKELAGE